MDNNDSSFWKSNTRSIPGRPSPKKDIPKVAAGSTTSFERYQKSVSDAWTLSEDELTKEYCILSDEPKVATRRLMKPANLPIGVHRHQTTSSSSASSTSSSSNNSATVVKITAATAATNNNISAAAAEPARDENENQSPKKAEPPAEKPIEYG